MKHNFQEGFFIEKPTALCWHSRPYLPLENCPSGTFFDTISGNCTDCPLDQYNGGTGKVGQCIVCPEKTYTIAEGSKNITQCLGMCLTIPTIFIVLRVFLQLLHQQKHQELFREAPTKHLHVVLQGKIWRECAWLNGTWCFRQWTRIARTIKTLPLFILISKNNSLVFYILEFIILFLLV